MTPKKFINDKGNNLFHQDALSDQNDNEEQLAKSCKYTYHQYNFQDKSKCTKNRK